MSWQKLKEFPDYEINELGVVRTIGMKNELQKYPIGETYTYMLLDRNDNPKIRVVASLLRSAFQEEEE
jgi:hypothetical protein